MKLNFRLINLMGLALIALAVPSNARAGGITQYTDPGSFNAVLAPGSYYASFSQYDDEITYSGPISFSGMGFSYNVVGGTQNVLAAGTPALPDLGNDLPGGTTNLEITGGTVTAISLYAYTTDAENNPLNADPTSVTVNGGPTQYTNSTPFFGFTDTAGITSIVISTSVGSDFTVVTQATVGELTLTAVPEPSSLVLLGSAALGGVVVGLRKWGRRPTKTA